MHSCAVFQEDSSSQEKEVKGTVWLLEEVFIHLCCEVMCSTVAVGESPSE